MLSVIVAAVALSPVPMKSRKLRRKRAKFTSQAKSASSRMILADRRLGVSIPSLRRIGQVGVLQQGDWTDVLIRSAEMAYVGQTELLCQAIVSHDLETVKGFMAREDTNPDRRDYTGRTPLQLACIASTPEIVQVIVDRGARLIARMADGKTALHLAASRGRTEIVRILLKKSNENQERESQNSAPTDVHMSEANEEEEETPADNASQTSASYVKVDQDGAEEIPPALDTFDDNEQEPDIYDINVIAWDSLTSPLHLAILHGHIETVKELVASFGADVLMPIKIVNQDEGSRAAILTLVLALALPEEEAKEMSQALLQLGASPAQADVSHLTPLHYIAQSKYNDLLALYLAHNGPAVHRAINHISLGGRQYYPSFCTPFINALCAKNGTAAKKLLAMGAKTTLDIEDCMKAVKTQTPKDGCLAPALEGAKKSLEQPILHAVKNDLPLIALQLLEKGLVDPNAISKEEYGPGKSVLDCVRDALGQLRYFLKPQETSNQRCLPERWFAFEKDYDSYLAEFEEGTYKMFFAKNQLKKARKNNKTLDDWEEIQYARPDTSQMPGTSEKENAIRELILDYQRVETELLSRGGKTYNEIQGLDEPGKNQQRWSPDYNDPEDKPTTFKFEFFGYPDLTATSREGYVKLYGIFPAKSNFRLL